MRTFFVYLQLECKRTMKNLPYILAGVIVLVLLAGTIAFSAADLLYGDAEVGRIQVAVVKPEEDLLAEKVLDMIESLDSVNGLCTFTYLDEKNGMDGLRRGDFFALMKVPEGLVEGIMDGSNVPVVVVFPERARLEAAVFRELTEAGCSILSTAQAGIYAADEYLYGNERSVFVPKAEEDLNRIFLSYALDREVYFRKETVNAGGDVGITVHFVIAALTLVIFLTGIPAAPLMRNNGPALQQKLAAAGVRSWLQAAIRGVCMWGVLILMLLMPLVFAVCGRYIVLSAVNLVRLAAVCGITATWILFCYEMCRNSSAAILVLFCTVVVMMFLSGGIVPSVFLPEGIREIGKYLPTNAVMELLKRMVTG